MAEKDPLQNLKNSMIDLRSGNLDVEADNPKIVKCWERLDCRKTDCPAYGRLRCWSIAGTLCHEPIQGEQARQLGDCRKCIVYRESCGDEIAELLEVFNQTVRELKYNFDRAEKQRAELERYAALEEMAATVAHETKNPLQAISIAASYLKRHCHGDILTEFLSVIEAEVRRLDAVIETFLLFARPAPLHIEEEDLNTLIEESIALFAAEAAAKEVAIRPRPMPGTAPIRCDTARIRQGLAHLLQNALDASAAGQEITVAVARDNGDWLLTVRDQGPGLETADRSAVLHPFYTTKTGGLGLGLAIVDRTVREHDGEIGIRSRPGGGTEVMIRLPCAGPAR